MGKTQINGKRIAPQSIILEHFNKELKIPEEFLQLNYDSHMHQNLSVLDVFKNTNPNMVKELDVKDIYLSILEIDEARDKGVTLKKTIQSKALKEDLDKVIEEMTDFKGDNATLRDAYEQILLKIKNTMDSHSGITSHKELDSIYNEILNARGIYSSLSERLNNTSVGDGSTGSGGSSNGSVSVWNAKTILVAGERIITTPNRYSVGTNSLFVYEGPILLSPGSKNDYVEVDENTIALNNPLTEDTEFTFMGVDTGSLYEWCIRISTTENQSVIPTMYKYKQNLDQLVVYEDGMLLASGVDYTERDEYSIVMVEPLPENCSITIAKRR